jgi:hypothetical protein
MLLSSSNTNNAKNVKLFFAIFISFESPGQQFQRSIIIRALKTLKMYCDI